MKTTLKSKHDYLFKHNIENHIKNIIVYDIHDQWHINQNHHLINEEEHRIWKELFSKVYSLACDNSNNIFKNGLKILENNSNNFSSIMPNLEDISKVIKKHTGWQIRTVAGFVDEVIFFELLSDKYFPSSDIIRLSSRFYDKYKNTNVRNELSYTPEPDIFHEIFGHAPFLFDEDYCNLLQNIGKLGNEIINSTILSDDLKSHNLKRLQNFVWWTLEFGVIKSDSEIGFEIFGAGILSSYDEIKNVINNKDKIVPYCFEDVIMTRFDYSDLQDRYYIVDSFDTIVKDFKDKKELFYYKGSE